MSSSTDAPHHEHAIIVAGFFASMAAAISLHQIYGHLRHYTAPQYQKYIVRIIGMVPVYALEAFMSLLLKDLQHFFQALRDSYEAYVIYTFFALLIEYLDGEQRIVNVLEGHERMKHPWPFQHWKPVRLNAQFLRRCKQGTLQFVFVKPFMAMVSFILSRYGKYDEGQLRLDGGYFYISFITNVSITLSLYGLIYFYLAVSQELAPFKPLPKYFCIKSVVFFSYWQSVGLMGLVQIGMIPDIDSAVFLQNLIICIEMFFAAIAYRFAFTWEFGGRGSRPPLLSNIKDVMSIHDVLNDAHETFVKEKVSSNKIEMKPYQETPTDDLHLGSQSQTLRRIQGRHNKKFYQGLGKDLEEDITEGTAGPSTEGGYQSCDEDLEMVTEEDLSRMQTGIQSGMVSKPSNYELEDNLSDLGLEDAMEAEGVTPAGTADLAAAFLASDGTGDIGDSTVAGEDGNDGTIGTIGADGTGDVASGAPVPVPAAASTAEGMPPGSGDSLSNDHDDPFAMFASPAPAASTQAQESGVTPTPVKQERDEMLAYMDTLNTPAPVSTGVGTASTPGQGAGGDSIDTTEDGTPDGSAPAAAGDKGQAGDGTEVTSGDVTESNVTESTEG